MSEWVREPCRASSIYWAAADSLSQQYPQIDVRRSALYIDHDDVLTSAGTASTIDACLHIVRTSLGSAAASTLARHLVLAPHRDGGQAQFIERPVPQEQGAGPIGDTIQWALENLDQDLSVEGLAVHACMSGRSFARRFREATGSTPARWVLARRLDAARTLLETTTWSIERIARECGFQERRDLPPELRRSIRNDPDLLQAPILRALAAHVDVLGQESPAAGTPQCSPVRFPRRRRLHLQRIAVPADDLVTGAAGRPGSAVERDPHRGLSPRLGEELSRCGPDRWRARASLRR